MILIYHIFTKLLVQKLKSQVELQMPWMKNRLNYSITQSGPGKPRGQGGHAPLLFCVTKRKKENKEKKIKRLLKDCHQVQTFTVLDTLERLELKNFSFRLTMVAGNTFQCSIAPPLWNPFRRPCRLISQSLITAL